MFQFAHIFKNYNTTAKSYIFLLSSLFEYAKSPTMTHTTVTDTHTLTHSSQQTMNLPVNISFIFFPFFSSAVISPGSPNTEPGPTYRKCPEDTFPCVSGHVTCVNRSLLCDSKSDCDDGSDEGAVCEFLGHVSISPPPPLPK